MSLFFAVVWGDKTGIFATWAEASAAIGRKSAPLVKRFTNRADAESFLIKNTTPHIRASGRQIPLENRSIAHVHGCTETGRSGYAVHVLMPCGTRFELSGFLQGPLSESEAQLCSLYALLANFDGDMLVFCDPKAAAAIGAHAEAAKLADGDFIAPVRELMRDRSVELAGDSGEGYKRDVAQHVRDLALAGRLQDEPQLEKEFPRYG